MLAKLSTEFDQDRLRDAIVVGAIWRSTIMGRALFVRRGNARGTSIN